VTTISFSYTVGSARFSCETEVEDWDELEQDDRLDVLRDAALEDVGDMLDVEEDSIDDEVE
jgi:hypothetical protein